MDKTVKLAHGSGRGLDELLHEAVLPELGPGDGGVLEDAAVLKPGAASIAFTTDSFVVHPLEFRGGDIGKLAACGTINDLAAMGAVPTALSVALIIEEGMPFALLRKLLHSLRATADAAGVPVVCGDTKVVERGKADGVFITTSGIGTVPAGRNLSAAAARPGDAVLVSGPVGQHGVTVLSERKGLAFASDVVSDCAALNGLAEALFAAVPDVRVLRDATRGGCAAVLNEIAAASGVTITVREADIPVSDAVQGACRFLGMDPMQIANEGRFVAVVPGERAGAALDAFRAHELGSGAAVIGTVGEKGRFPALLSTRIGGTRPVEVPHGELLPRIC